MIKKIENEFGWCKYHLEDDNEMVFIIDEIESNGRRNGNGSRLLSVVETAILNEGGKRIELFAWPLDDTITESELYEFYMSQGYRDEDGCGSFYRDIA